MGRLSGKRAIVTGAGSGIGEAIAKKLASENARVVIAERNASAGRRVEIEINSAFPGAALFIETDIVNPASVDDMVAKAAASFGPPNVLINNAGINVFGAPLEITDQDWKRCMSVDLDGAWNCCRAVLPHMLAAKAGAIVNIASNHAERIIKGTFPYPVAKHAMLGLTRSLALEYADQGVAVNAISPGYVMTPLTQAYFDEQDDPAAFKAKAEASQPVKRLGRPEEVAALAVLLASDEARFIVGANLVIDGGITIRMYE
jgi:NAD(P)-dependent dehydrogenase (short-subunit alcohol dehydrogenase family)